jgi:enolase-phosphatase E1
MVRYILTDIEGTTTSIKFVCDTLFPYFKKHFLSFFAENYPNDGIAENIQAVQATVLAEENKAITEAEAVAKLMEWADADRKHTALKNLQGIVWQLGYRKGEIKGHIYPDVPPKLEEWLSMNVQVGIYSSGSVQAQQLIFGYSVFGDLTPYFSHYFDTLVGGKRETQSYLNIQDVLELPAEMILFLSDVEAELDAAQAAGFQTIQLVREGTVPGKKHQTVQDFTEIVISH